MIENIYLENMQVHWMSQKCPEIPYLRGKFNKRFKVELQVKKIGLRGNATFKNKRNEGTKTGRNRTIWKSGIFRRWRSKFFPRWFSKSHPPRSWTFETLSNYVLQKPDRRGPRDSFSNHFNDETSRAQGRMGPTGN